jgi:hypothetical protein
VREAIRNKKECYRNLGKCRSTKNFEKYKVAKREAKEAIRKAREKKTRDFGMVKCIKDDDYRVFVKDEEIKESWRSYFDRLFNRNQVQDVSDLAITSAEVNSDFIRNIHKHEVREALKRIRPKKAVGPDGIPIEVWKYLGEIDVV